MGSVNLKSIRRKIKNLKAFEALAIETAEEKIDELRREAIRNFLDHPITIELDNGATGNNTSQSLGGIGNLFSFIGFESNAKPTKPVEVLLGKLIYLKRLGAKTSHSGIRFDFRVNYPELADFDAVAKMPWSGESWVRGIEDGISGFGYYLLKRSNESRSGTAIQSDHRIRSASFKRTSYITEIIKEFKLGVKSSP